MRLLITFLLLVPLGCLAGEDALTFTSYNVRNDNASDTGGRDWKKRRGMLTAYLKAQQADFIGLQEVKHNQLLEVARDLDTHAHVGVGRDDGKTRGEYSPIFYRKDRWSPDPEEQGTFWLSASPGVPGSKTWGNRYPRICTWARFTGLAGSFKGKAIYVYNTHWDHQSQPSRVEAAGLMLKRLGGRAHGGNPVIVMGDFNATTDNPAIKRLLGSGKLIDHGRKQFRTSSLWKVALVPGLRIDHVFTSPGIPKGGLTVETNAGAEGHAASDHHPVVLRVPALP